MKASRTIHRTITAAAVASLLSLASCHRPTLTQQAVEAETREAVTKLEIMHSGLEGLQRNFNSLANESTVASVALAELKKPNIPYQARIEAKKEANYRQMRVIHQEMIDDNRAVLDFLEKHYQPEELASILKQIGRETNYSNPRMTPYYYKDPAWDESQVQAAYRESINHRDEKNRYIHGGEAAVVLLIILIISFS